MVYDVITSAAALDVNARDIAAGEVMPLAVLVDPQRLGIAHGHQDVIADERAGDEERDDVHASRWVECECRE